MLTRVPCPALTTSSFRAFCYLLDHAGCGPLGPSSTFPTYRLPVLLPYGYGTSQPLPTAQDPPRPTAWATCTLPFRPARAGLEILTVAIPGQPTQRGTTAHFSKLGGHGRQPWQLSLHSPRHCMMQQFYNPSSVSQVGRRSPTAAYKGEARPPWMRTHSETLSRETFCCSHISLVWHQIFSAHFDSSVIFPPLPSVEVDE